MYPLLFVYVIDMFWFSLVLFVCVGLVGWGWPDLVFRDVQVFFE